MMWMPYICVIAFAIAAAAPRYRRTALIMCGAFIINIPIEPVIYSFHSYLQPTAWGYYDGITAFILLKYGSKGAIWQAKALLAALSVNIILLVDLLTGWNLIYSVYAEAILIVNVIAILMMGGAYGDIIRIFRRSHDRGYGVRGTNQLNVTLVEPRQTDKGSS